MAVPSENSHGDSGRQFGWYLLSTTGDSTFGIGGSMAGFPYGLSAPSGTSVSWMLLRARLPVISSKVSHSRATIVTRRVARPGPARGAGHADHTAVISTAKSPTLLGMLVTLARGWVSGRHPGWVTGQRIRSGVPTGTCRAR